MNLELHRAVVRLRTLVGDRLPDLTSRPDPEFLGRQIAAGALARMMVLLDGVLSLVAAGRGDAAGGLTRSMFELESLGLYVLLGGKEAVLTTMGDYMRSMKTFHQQGGSEAPPRMRLLQALLLPELGGGAFDRKLNYEALALKAADLVRERGESGAGHNSAQKVYDTLYRAESILSVHATLGSVGPYLDLAADRWSLRERSSIHDTSADEDRVVLGARMTAHLAAYVFDAFGFSRAATDALWLEIDALP
jgi:hypothetical protein